MAKDMVAEAREEEDEAEKPGFGSKEKDSDARKRGGGTKKRAKGGGMVHGKPAMASPFKRARGGGTSELRPTTAAGNVSSPDYLSKGGDAAATKGSGGDKGDRRD